MNLNLVLSLIILIEIGIIGFFVNSLFIKDAMKTFLLFTLWTLAGFLLINYKKVLSVLLYRVSGQESMRSNVKGKKETGKPQPGGGFILFHVNGSLKRYLKSVKKDLRNEIDELRKDVESIRLYQQDVLTREIDDIRLMKSRIESIDNLMREVQRMKEEFEARLNSIDERVRNIEEIL